MKCTIHILSTQPQTHAILLSQNWYRTCQPFNKLLCSPKYEKHETFRNTLWLTPSKCNNPRFFSLFPLYNNCLLNFWHKQLYNYGNRHSHYNQLSGKPSLLQLQLQEQDLLVLQDPICYTKSSLQVYMSCLLLVWQDEEKKCGTKTNKPELVAKTNWDDDELIFSPISLSKDLK